MRWWWRGRAEPGYRANWAERLGFFGGDAQPRRIWVHAVSLGETRAAAPLVAALREACPGRPILLTHGTATGRAAGAALLQPGDAQAWLPLDTPGAVRRFLRRHRPAVGVLMETEVWPNLLHAARAAGVPMVLANARLSPRSLAKGERLRSLMAPAVGVFDAVLAQTADDAARLAAIGARPGALEVCGNLKFDMTPDAALLARGRAWRDAPGAGGRPLVLAASTREGEEGPLLADWRAKAPAAGPAPRLLLVPRHPQRFDEVAALVAREGFTLARRSNWPDGRPPPEAAAAEVWLGDSVGEMALYYAAAEAALLGGSFAPLGGQNLIEAAACGCPLWMGPHTFNFAEAADEALAAGAAERAAGFDAAVHGACALAADPPRRAAMAARALAFAAAHRGAARRMAGRIAACLPTPAQL